MVANRYPSHDDIYRNGFIHRRVKAYQEAGEAIRVYYVDRLAPMPIDYEFDGVEVQRGTSEHLHEFLRGRSFDKFLVHFPSPEMLEPIRAVSPGTPVIAWVHGFETEQWHRRWFNIADNPTRIRHALRGGGGHYKRQLEFMKWLFTTAEMDITIVQISKWFQEYVSEVDVRAEARKSVVIPNIIDSDLFPYREKDAEQRKKILSIRPFASRKYANDLTAGAVKLLSRRPFFDDLQFSFHGDGDLWDSTVGELSEFPNVHLNRGFLLQDQISGVHADHGIFLAPTRFDSQGVSMCEAMSSGLVTLSTRIAAVPEFIEHEVSGLLGSPESAEDVADLIEMLYLDPDLFLRISRTAAEAIRDQCGPDATVGKELELIKS